MLSPPVCAVTPGRHIQQEIRMLPLKRDNKSRSRSSSCVPSFHIGTAPVVIHLALSVNKAGGTETATRANPPAPERRLDLRPLDTPTAALSRVRPDQLPGPVGGRPWALVGLAVSAESHPTRCLLEIGRDPFAAGGVESLKASFGPKRPSVHRDSNLAGGNQAISRGWRRLRQRRVDFREGCSGYSRPLASSLFVQHCNVRPRRGPVLVD